MNQLIGNPYLGIFLLGSGIASVVLNLIILLAVLYALIWVGLGLLSRRWSARQPAVYLELIPPIANESIPQDLFRVLHGLITSLPLKDRILRHRISLSLELVATASGVKFIARVPKQYQRLFKQHFYAYLPTAQIKRTRDFIDFNAKLTRASEFRQAADYLYPLQTTVDLVPYLLSAVANLETHESMALQLVVSPISSARALWRHDRLNKIRRRGWLIRPSQSLYSRLWLYLKLAEETWSNSYISGMRKADISYRPAAGPADINAKLASPLFKTNLRLLVQADQPDRLNQLDQSVKTALAILNNPGQQALLTRASDNLRQPILRQQFKRRSLNRPSVFSIDELAAIYHLPANLTQIEAVPRSMSSALPAPLISDELAKPDVTIGQNIYHGLAVPIGLSVSDRQQHVYLVGGTGSGKTTMMKYMIAQDLKNGKGLAVIDPHGDLAQAVLTHVPKSRIKDVIYLDPSDINHPVGLNLLELPAGLKGSALEKEKEFIVESVVSVLRKTFADRDSGGHRLEYIIRNAAYTALTVDNATVFTILRLLTDTSFRRRVVAGLTEPDLKRFWLEEFNPAGSMQRVKMTAGVTAKLGRFRRSVIVRRIFGQVRSTINFDDIINNRMILICNLAKGNLGEDNAQLIGTAILAELQLAGLRRSRLASVQRRPFYIYVDEFQDFATVPFLQMLSEARKYQLLLNLAGQSLAQLDKDMARIILANVGTVICFRTGNQADEHLLLPLFKPYVSEGEIIHLANYSFYAKLGASGAQPPTSGETICLADGSKSVARDIIQASRRHYAYHYLK